MNTIKIAIILLLLILLVNYFLNQRENFDNDVPWDKAFYINVDGQTTRDKYMKREFRKQKINVTRFNAIDKKKIDDNYIQNLINDIKLTPDNEIKKRNNQGTLACLLSHHTLWEKIYNEEKGDMYLIFEDDCYLDSNFKEECKKYIKHLPSDWDMAWLGYNKFVGPDNSNIFNKPIIQKPHRRGINAQHHCYLINRKSVPKFKNILFPHNGLRTKDCIIRDNFDKFNAYFLFKKLAHQDTDTFKISTRDNGTNG